MPFSRLLPYALAYAGGVIGYLPLLTLLLPAKVERLAGDQRLAVLTAIVVAGALASSASNVLFGALTDRSVARGGGRRGWLVGGAAATAVAYAGIAAAETPGALIGAIVLWQAALNAMLAALMALMADEVPDRAKSTLGGLLAFANPLASALSALLVAGPLGETARLMLVPLAAGACLVPMLLVRGAAQGGEVSGTATRADLAIAWAARLLVQVAGNVLFLYLLYYFESVSPGAGPGAIGARVGSLLTVAYLLPLPVAVLAGRWADRSGRPKPVLFAAAAVAAAGLTGMALARTWPAGAASFVVYAIGSATFLALHAGFAMQLLPSARHRGRDLGLVNLANTLPALAGPALTWWLASPDDFRPLMLCLAGLTLAGGPVLLGARGAQRFQ